MKAICKTLVLISMLLLTACSAKYFSNQQDPTAGLPFRLNDYDYKMAWKTTSANNVVAIDGILKNIRYAYISSIDLTVFLTGTDGKVRARVTVIPFPQQSQVDDLVSFSARLNNVTLMPGDTFNFVIHYAGNDGGHDGMADWHKTFVVDASTGAVLKKENQKPKEW